MEKAETPFSARLRLLRKASGLSMQQLANKAKLTRQAVHILEVGRRKPSLATAKALAKALGVSVAEF